MFNYELMKQICLADITEFESLGDVEQTPTGIYIYKDNNASILGVAHLDSVLDTSHFYQFSIMGVDYVLNAQLDDRLGVYVMLDVLPHLGIQFDLLLTEGEETGNSTAAYFETKKDYNWMFSFDRRGTGCVLYQYDTPNWKHALKENFRIDLGSFSDICFLDHLGVNGVNVGTGYHGEHDALCYADMSELSKQIMKFRKFYKNNHDIQYSYTYQPPKSKGYTYDPYGRYGNMAQWELYDKLNDPISSPRANYGTSSTSDTCVLCHETEGDVYLGDDIFLCEDCFQDAGQCLKCSLLFYDYDLIDGLCANCSNQGVKFANS